MCRKYPILWSFRRCPYAMRARLAIYANNLTVELREISLKNKPREFLINSPKGTVPVLKLKNGEIIDESNDIINWSIDSSNDVDNWITPLNNKIIDDNFLSFVDGKFKSDLDRYKYSNRFNSNKNVHRSSGEKFLNKIEKILNQQQFLSGNQIGLIDYSTLPFIRQFRIADTNWFDNKNWPKLHLWLNDFLTSDIFLSIMKKYDLWSKDSFNLFGKNI